MTFSLISIAIMLITALVITIEVLRATRRGIQKTLVSLASIFLALFSSIVITRFLSKVFTNIAIDELDIDLSSIEKTFPSANSLMYSFTDALVAPIVFLFVFLIMRVLIAIVISIVNKANYKKVSEKPYQQEDAPQYQRKPRLVSGLLGAFCGFMIMTVCISPIFGTLKVMSKALKGNDEAKVLSLGLGDELIAYVDGYSKDFSGSIIYYCGGNLVYKAVATSTLNDNHFAVGEEVEETFENYDKIASVGTILNDLDGATPEMKASAHDFGDNINRAETLKALSYDIFPKLAKSWLDDKPYSAFGATWSKPNVNGACESFFNKMLNVCRQSTPDTVGQDFTTLINVYIIAHENGILFTQDYKTMVEKATATGAFELIRKELSKNPRMAGIAVDIDTMSTKSLASALQMVNINNYENLMNNMMGMLNYSMIYSDKSQQEFIKNNITSLINNYGIGVGGDIVDTLSEQLVEDVIGNKSSVTVDDIKSFWEKYATSNGLSTALPDTSTQTTPSTDTQQSNNSTNQNQSPVETDDSNLNGGEENVPGEDELGTGDGNGTGDENGDENGTGDENGNEYETGDEYGNGNEYYDYY